MEGQTEVEVFNVLLNSFVSKKTGVHVAFTPIKHSKGGMVKFDKILIELRNHLKDKGKIVSTFFDYYAIQESHNFRYFNEAKKKQSNPLVGVELLERGMVEVLKEKKIDTRNFIPYIQLHEFEALLFSSAKGFEFMFHNGSTIKELNKIRNRYQSPEEINDNLETAPSKRLISIVKSQENKFYRKVVFGVEIAKRVGIETMIDKCPRFGNWVNQIIQKMNQ